MMKRGYVRIIAGKWRGRKIPVAEVKDLRPTPDRVRETVFNWLAQFVPGSRCLDLFAGTGAMGLEALSRGASGVEFVDTSPLVAKHLQAIVKEVGINTAKISAAEVPKGLAKPPAPFNIVFIDPPYAAELLLPTCFFLEANHFLAQTAYIYLEGDALIGDNALPENWTIIRQKQAGNVFYHLAKRISL